MQLELQVKPSVWVMGEPLLTPVMVADAVWLMAVLPLVLLLRDPGSASPRLPDASVPPVYVPVTAVVSETAEPFPSLTSVIAPMRLVLTASEYDPGAVTVNCTV